MNAHLRIARPVSDLERSVAMYRNGLGLSEIGRFEDHAGFHGVMLGRPGLSYHFEFTYCRTHPVTPAPTPEDLVVFYLPETNEWQKTCSLMLEAGFTQSVNINPYWQQRGRTFRDHDRYLVVLEQASWRNGDSSPLGQEHACHDSPSAEEPPTPREGSLLPTASTSLPG